MIDRQKPSHLLRSRAVSNRTPPCNEQTQQKTNDEEKRTSPICLPTSRDTSSQVMARSVCQFHGSAVQEISLPTTQEDHLISNLLLLLQSHDWNLTLWKVAFFRGFCDSITSRETLRSSKHNKTLFSKPSKHAMKHMVIEATTGTVGDGKMHVIS